MKMNLFTFIYKTRRKTRLNLSTMTIFYEEMEFFVWIV